MKIAPFRLEPYMGAMAFGVFASAIAAGISFFDGTLVNEKVINHAGNAFIQYPYIRNISTIFDFAIFDPIAIFFLLNARRGFKTAFQHFEKNDAFTPFHQVAIILVSIILGLAAMWFYFKGLIDRNIYTESFAPGANDRTIITTAGWAIFIFTSAFIALVALVTIEFGNYILFVRQLGVDRFRFTLPPNISADIKIAASPCVHAAYVLATLFFTLAIFVIQDAYQFDIRESRRVWLLAPYVIACIITFLPFWHLHKVMSERKKIIIDNNNEAIEKDITTTDRDSLEAWAQIDPNKLSQFIDKIRDLQSFYDIIPVWPVSVRVLFVPNLSFVISVVTLLYKLANTLYAAGTG